MSMVRIKNENRIIKFAGRHDESSIEVVVVKGCAEEDFWFAFEVVFGTSDPQDYIKSQTHHNDLHSHCVHSEINMDSKSARELANRIIKWCDEIERTI